VSSRTILLIGHVGAAVLLIGPTIVAASLFPRYARSAGPDPGDRNVARALHRITVGYGNAGIVIPILGLVLAFQQELLTEHWVLASLALVLASAAVLLAAVIPGQRRILERLTAGDAVEASDLGGLRATSGIVSLVWMIVVILMVWKP
jgi:hypothetical protein